MIRIFRTHPLDLHDVRSRIASSLGRKDLASCTRVSQDWYDSFTPPLYNSITLSNRGPSMESIERNKHVIQRLRILSCTYDNLPSASVRYNVICSIMANSTLVIVDLADNAIGPNGAVALSEALKTNSTLTTLNLECNSIEDDGVIALSEALKINSTLTTLSLHTNPIRNRGAKALSEALKTNSTLTKLNLQSTMIVFKGAVFLSDALKINSTVTIRGVRL
ncbi:MAG: hypothetical protein J3R72DRAFT_23218 [Linnemannia gamsii]|nr:MAG: hypothetical protein J3R72DRAFT_23218 [Linnemannia gamsii]